MPEEQEVKEPQKEKWASRQCFTNILPFENKEFPFKGRLDIVYKDVRNNTIETKYITVFGKDENEVMIKIAEEKAILGVK